MPCWLFALLSVQALPLTEPHPSVRIEPKEGSLAGGTWLTVSSDDLVRGVLYPTDGSQLEIDLVNVAVPSLPRIPCDVSPVLLDLPVVTCRTRSLQSEAHEGLYSLEVRSGGQVVGSSCTGSRDSCTFRFSKAQTPFVYRVDPPSGAPGELIHVHGWIITGKLETFDSEAEYIDSPLILEAQGDRWITPCSLINRHTGDSYHIQEDHGLGTVQCRVEGHYIGSSNASFSVFNKGRSMVHKDAWLVSAKQDLFLYQTHSEILSVFPDTGSLEGRTDITITGDFFDTSAQVTIAGIPCDIRHVSPRRIECTTRAPGKGARLTAPQAGNRGLLFEVGEAAGDIELTEDTPGYRWQIVPNASSPSRFWPREGHPFRSRLSGFFMAPETNNYTFWIQADSQASLHFSWSEEPRTKVQVASVGAGTADWFDSWEQNGDDGVWNQKTPKLELLGGAKYYLEAEHHGIAPSRGMRIGVQVHNTWLNPDVVPTYLLEKHQIRARAQRLPEIQMLNVKGLGNFFLTWDNVSSQPILANATAQQVQSAIEELLAVKCTLDPVSANILLRLGFEQGLQGSSSDGVLTSATEPFCGRFSLHRPRHLVLVPLAAEKGYRLDQYPWLCIAYKGHTRTTLRVTVSFTSGLRNVIKKNSTCNWSLVEPSPESWQFTCTNLWDACLWPSEDLQPSPPSNSVLVHRIDILPVAQDTGLLYMDEIIITDTHVTVSQGASGTARSGVHLVESVSVAGSPPVYNITSWLVGCGTELPLISACSVSTEGTEEGAGLFQVTAQRLQRSSSPLGGHFLIQLADTVIPDVPVHISAGRLHKLLQDNADDVTSRYLNVSDFTVTEDLASCYEHVWTLSWTTQVGDLPNFIRVSDQNLTGMTPAVAMRVVYDGGVFLGPIFGDMLASANQKTQVVVRVNDIPAHCQGSCSFQYLQGSTPTVHFVWYSLGHDNNALVHLIGTGFSNDSWAIQVMVNKTNCEVISSNHTNVACQTDLLPAGIYQMSMLVRPSGLAVNASGEGLFLYVEPRLNAVEPSRASEIGGLWATIRGSGLEGVNLVLFGSQSCTVNVTSSNSHRIQCRVPPRGEDGYIVNVTVVIGDHSAVLVRAFIYDPSLNPVIVSLSRNRSSIAGGAVIVLGTARPLPVNGTDMDVRVRVRDTSAQVRAPTAQGLEAVLPALPAGVYTVSVSVNGVSLHSQGVDLHIQYITEISSIEPCSGSLLGGTVLSLSGIGLSTEPALMRVLVGKRPCDIVKLTEMNIWCKTPPASTPPSADALTVPAQVEVWVGNTSLTQAPASSLVAKGLTFAYEAAATPVVTALWGEFTNDSLGLYVEGHNLSQAVILLGNLECDIQVQPLGGNMTASGCHFPLRDLEAGTYPLQVHHKKMGFADMSAVPQQFEVTPRITAVFPMHGSVCGGTVLTVKGFAFRSRRRSIQVDLSGPVTCAILSEGDHTVQCQINVVSDHLPGASFTLKVTVLVNGLTSECQGNCTFFMQEEATPVVDALSIDASGSVTTVLMRGQRLGTTAHEPAVLVDDRLSCLVTFFNASHVACLVSDLTPGQHYLSALHTSTGYACFCNVSRHFCITPRVWDYFPRNFSVHGGSLLTLEGTALQGQNATLVYVGAQACLTVSISSELIQCFVPAGNGSVALETEVDGVSYHVGVIGLNSAFTPELLSVSQNHSILTFTVARISGAANVDLYIGTSPCVGVQGNRTVLQCLVPSLPAGEYPVRGYDHNRGWASSVLILTLRAAVTAVTGNFGCPGGRLLHVFGVGFSPGNISAAVCGEPCQVLTNATVSAFSCLVLSLDVSLAFLCDLRHAEDSCAVISHTYVQCDVTVTVGTERLPGSWPYLYFCEESAQCLFVPDGWTESAVPSFSGLFISPKVERDEVLIYNSSCNITMETESEMECETPNQPITTKITEIRRSWDQNTQGDFSFQLCRRWSRARTWFPRRAPQDGDNVTVEKGRLLLLDGRSSVLNFLHIKGGKLIFMEPGPIELRAHSILITDGGALQIGSKDKPFHGRAQITLYGSSHSSPFFPYGIKFLAVRNGTLSLHGSTPEVIVTHLRAAARARDMVLALEDAVDWHPGDEVVIISGTGAQDAKPAEEIVTVESVYGSDLRLRSPLRYSYNFTESVLGGKRHVFRATVALLSRSITIGGNLTMERMQRLTSCLEVRASEGDLQHCLYSKSEKTLGSSDLGARVIIQSFLEEPSLVQLKGVQFRDMGQAFRKHVSSLTLVGALQGSYIQGCTVWGSFSRGLSMFRTWGLRVDSNVFYKILGHALLVGKHMEGSYTSWKTVAGRETDWSEQGNIIRNNVIISVSGAEGLSNVEMLAPSGIYVRSPTNVIEGNGVCAAGHGYFFHLATSWASQAPLLSFAQNTAHFCTRFGLFVYPKFQPLWNKETGPTVLQDFTVWESTGGAQIFRSSNLRLKNFQVYSCRDFGIDIVESDANTSVTDSVFLGHFIHKGNLCMSAGIKTPKRWELMVSNTTFVNFDLINCVAIRTCSGCSQGQGGFSVMTQQLKFTNSSNVVAFPFPHAAVLEDLDGSVSGQDGSHILASMQTLASTCSANASFSQLVPGSVCGEGVLFHRMSIGLANDLGVSNNLTLTDSRNKTTTVNYVRDTLSNQYGWMALLLDQETYSLHFEIPWTNKSLQYSATLDSFAAGNYILLVHTNLPPYPTILITCGSQAGQSLQDLPWPGQDKGCDWFFNSQLRQLTYLVSGQGQVKVFLQVKEGVPPTISASTLAPGAALKWSSPETWQDVEEGWGGYNHSIPGPGDDVVILPNRTVIVDTDLPLLKGLYVMGTLAFPVDRSNVLSVACLLIAGGELRVGTLENPLEKEQKFLINVRASEEIFCDRFYGIRIDSGTIGIYGKVLLHSAYSKKPWAHLGADIASGNERIILEEAVDWQPGDKFVLGSSSYEPHEAEVLTVREVKARDIRIRERLKHRHIGSSHVTEDGRHIRLAVEVGLLTRNIRIQSDTRCRGSLLVGSFGKSNREEFSGVLQLLNVEIQNFGSALHSSIEFLNVSWGSWVMSSSLHQSCGGGIHASASHGIILNDNIVFGTYGHGIDLEGKNYSLSNNLILLTMQPDGSSTWVAGIKVNRANEVTLQHNVVAGSERVGFHVRGHGCSSEVPWSGNVAHSSLHGLHLYKESGPNNCTGISGFLAFKNLDYGAMVHTENSLEMENITLVDNAVGLLATVHVSSDLLSSVQNVQIVLRNSVIVATSSSFDCIQDRVKPSSANLTSTDRAPSNPRGGRVGILWPVFTSEPNRWPQEPWHKVRNGHSISGIVKLQDVTFSSFVRSCYSDDVDVCILPSEGSAGITYPITAERTRMLRMKDKNKFYFPPSHPRGDSESVIYPESECENPRKYLFKDLDGRTLGLPPPVSVFSKTEAEWTGSFFNTGIFREEQKCTFRAMIPGFICKQTDHVVLVVDSVDTTWTTQKSYPVVSVTSGFVDTFSGMKTRTSGCTRTSATTFYSIVPTGQVTRVCFVEQTPQRLRFLLLGNRNATKLILAVFYHEIQSPQVFLRERFAPPALTESASPLLEESAGANVFNLMENLLYVVLQGEEPVDVYTSTSIHLAFTVEFSVLEKGWEVAMLERLASFLRLGQNQIRFKHQIPGNEDTLRTIADSWAKRKRTCPTITCGSRYRRSGQRRPLMTDVNSYKFSPPNTLDMISKVIVIEIGDPPTVRKSGLVLDLPRNRLQNLAHQVITAQQTGVLENALNVTIGALLVTQAEGVTGYRNASSSRAGNIIYVRPWTLSVLVQPSDGEVGKELSVQPQLVLLDEKNRRVETLGLPSEPWTISASLEGVSDSVLKGNTQVETQAGYVSFSNLAVLISGSNWRFVFTVTSPPGVNFTARSKPFAILPVTGKERSTVILAVSLSSVVSWLTLICLLCCWFKRSKNRKIKPEDMSESQVNEQKNHIQFSSKRPGSRVETRKQDAGMGADVRMKVMLGRAKQPVDGVFRRQVSRRPVSEDEAVAAAPRIARVTSQGHTCAAASPAHQSALQEAGSWQEPREQLGRYQLAGQDQLLVLCPDLGQERQRWQEPGQMNQRSGCSGPSQERGSCVAPETLCLHSSPPETTQAQL